MSKNLNHFRGDSFGTSIFIEKPTDNYLKTLIDHYKACIILERSGKNLEALLHYVNSIEREISSMDNLNLQFEEILKIKEQDIEILNEDVKKLDNDLYQIKQQQKHLKPEFERLQQLNINKGKIIEKQKNFIENKKSSIIDIIDNQNSFKNDTKIPKTARARNDSPTTLV